MGYPSLKLSHRYIILRDILYRGIFYRYIISKDILYRGTFHRYIILRDIPAKAWQKGYPRDISYQPEGWQRNTLIYLPILRVGWEAYNSYQSISFRSLNLCSNYRAEINKCSRGVYSIENI